MHKIIIISLVIFYSVFIVKKSYSQVDRVRIGVKVGTPTIIGLTGEYLYGDYYGLSYDLSFLSSSNNRYAYGYVGFKKYRGKRINKKSQGKGFFTNAGLSLAYLYLQEGSFLAVETVADFTALSVQLTGGYQFKWGHFVMAPEIGYGFALWKDDRGEYINYSDKKAKYYPGFLASLSFGVAF